MSFHFRAAKIQNTGWRLHCFTTVPEFFYKLDKKFKPFMKKTTLFTVGLAGIVALLMAFTHQEPKYKNLKVLPKDITEQQMDSVMHHFSASLNVRCNYCHVRNDSAKTWDFASDDIKHKLTAREMMRMTEKINDKYFNVTGKLTITSSLLVTCFTCHHGSTEPATKAPPRQRPMQNNGDSTRRIQMTDSVRHNQ
jgi:3-polyprenyl-4-hydroxybenzoate decarboxylase